MTSHHAADKRTLQDDRAELEADPQEASPLTEGEGAPLAQDGTPPPDRHTSVYGLLGGAPIATPTNDLETPPAKDGMTASRDRPIND